tara:strand:- start:3170 stop:3607 length:438 start_codon:yes stop_codon:yes gene_type:complete
MKPARRSDYRFFADITTRWGDVDRIGHVNNAKYFTYDEQARCLYMDQRIAAAELDLNKTQFILAHIGCDFLVQLNHPSEIDYGIRAVRLGRSSIGLEGAAFVGDCCHCVTNSVLVWFDYHTQKAGPVPEPVRASILAFEPGQIEV